MQKDIEICCEKIIKEVESLPYVDSCELKISTALAYRNPNHLILTLVIIFHDFSTFKQKPEILTKIVEDKYFYDSEFVKQVKLEVESIYLTKADKLKSLHDMLTSLIKRIGLVHKLAKSDFNILHEIGYEIIRKTDFNKAPGIGICCYGAETMADKLKINQKTVRRRTAELVSLGVIEKSRKSRKPNTYKFPLLEENLKPYLLKQIEGEAHAGER